MFKTLTTKRFLLFCATAVGLLALSAFAFVQNTTAQPAPLFTPLAEDTAVTANANDPLADQYADQPGLLVRRQYAAVDTAALQNGTAERLTVTFFEGETFTLIHRRTDRHDKGFVWVGYLEGLPEQTDVSFSVYDGVLVGSFNALNRSYKIRPVNEQTPSQVAIEHLNYGAFPPAAEPIIPPDLPENLPQPDPHSPSTDDGSVIDIMVVYTPKARNSMGGTAASQALITLATSETNTGYDNSQIAPNVNLVYMGEINYTEVGFSTDLDRLRGTSDGYMDSVHTLRNTYHADLVVLLIDEPSYCGLAYLMTNNNVGFASNAFAAVHYTCATGYYSFGHEMGHNMGNQHDRLNGGNGGVYSYSYGYQNLIGSFRTVMAYNCPVVGCTRLNYYSNPNVLVGGRPTGVGQNEADSAYNALSMNNVAFTVANFRQRPAEATPTHTPTNTPTPLPTHTSTATPTFTPTSTPTTTPSPTAGPSATPSTTPPPTQTPIPGVPSPTPNYAYMTAVCGLQGDNIVTLRGHQWPDEDVDLLVNSNLIYTLPAGHGGFFTLNVTFNNPQAGNYLMQLISPNASDTLVVPLPCTAVTATPTVTKTPYVTLTSTPTQTPTNTPVPPTATPTSPYITAVANEASTEVTLQGYNWPSDEDIAIYYNEQLVATILAGHGGSFTLILTLEAPPTNGAAVRAVSSSANHTAFIRVIALFYGYLPYIGNPAVPPPPTATPTSAPPTPTATPQPPTDDAKVYLNQFRAIAGVPAVTFDDTLDDNCWQHARYMAENNDLTHEQTPELPFASPAGQICAEKGNAWLGDTFSSPYWQPTDAIDGWLSSVGHRLWLLYPTTPTFGFGFYTADNNRAGGALDVLSNFDSNADAGYGGWPVRYPAAQQSGIPATNYAITLQWPYFGPTPEITNTSLTTLGGTPIPHTATTSLPVGHEGVLVRSDEALPDDTVFVVTISGTYDGQPFNESWQFGTGTGTAVP